MSILEKLKEEGFSEFNLKSMSKADYVYVWANDDVALGVGRTSLKSGGNHRVSEDLSMKKILTIKDAGKSFLAAFASKVTNKPINLYAKLDTSPKISSNTSMLENEIARKFTKDTFMVINGKSFSKIDFNNEVVLPAVIAMFGSDSMEEIVATLCSKDGDFWSRVGSHRKTKEAMINILHRLCITKD
jgi:hypothetical protein